MFGPSTCGARPVLQIIDAVDDAAAVLAIMRTGATVTANPAEHPLPWRMEIAGATLVKVKLDAGDTLLLAPDKARLVAVMEAVKK